MSLTLSPLGIPAVTDANIYSPDVSKLTTGEIDGSGIFDKMMQISLLHVKDEYDSGRISGSDYANVYLGIITSMMQSAVQYALSYQEIAKLNAEIGLLRQKTQTELAQTSDVLIAGLGFNDNTVLGGNVGNQADLYVAQKDGFLRDAEQKAAKLLIDTWSLRKSIDDATLVSDANLDNVTIAAFVDKLKAGVNIT